MIFKKKKNILLELSSYIDKIEDLGIRSLVVNIVRDSPHKFWERASSSTGKHHPKGDNKKYGNLLHIKRACKVADDLIRAEEDWLEQITKDKIMAAIIIHDIAKFGKEANAENTVFEHPELIVEYTQKHKNITEHYNFIMSLVKTHMGRWGASRPLTVVERIVHYADYIASRKWAYGLK